MWPFLRDGDRVLVQCGRDNLRSGDVLVFQVNGRLVIHRLIDIRQTLTARRFVTCGDNVRRADAPVHVNQIVGPVIAVERGERVFKLTRLHWHLLGRSLAWLQRLFLKLRRRLE
ncbi:MAG: S24/S26 family peptidase [Caldilineaceae bacterium]|nr:S24/S26 family peptidase [Caldilineaceae bacterium]